MNNLKRVKWPRVFLISITLVILQLLFMLWRDSFSLPWIIITFLVFPIIGLLLTSRDVNTEKGCLSGKTKDQKRKYFESLHVFRDSNELFYIEQIRDLTDGEFEQYVNWWVKKNNA